MTGRPQAVGTTAGSEIAPEGQKVSRGRRRANESNAAAIRTRLVAWRQTPESQRPSLRALAVELGTSHQLLSFYLQGLDKWQKAEYEWRVKEIRDRATAENRHWPALAGSSAACRSSSPASYLSLPAVWAFIAFATNTPAADFCRMVRVNLSTLSHDSVTCNRSPEVSSIAFHAQPPDLPPMTLMEVGFAILCPLARHRRPQSSSCPSARVFVPRFFQTSPRDDALALH
jgi:hypothetical protein